jgi:hypothetical protein
MEEDHIWSRCSGEFSENKEAQMEAMKLFEQGKLAPGEMGTGGYRYAILILHSTQLQMLSLKFKWRGSMSILYDSGFK